MARTYPRVDPNLSLETSKFPVVFSILTKSGQYLTNSDEVRNDFKIYAELLKFRVNEQGLNIPLIEIIPVVPCSRTIIGDYFSEKFNEIGFNINDYFCMDMTSIPAEERYIAKALGSPGNNFISVFLKMCDPSKVQNCGKTFEKYGSLMMSVSFLDKFIDISSFSNPIQEGMLHYTVPLSNKMEATIQFNINNNVLVTDKGYIFSSIQESNFVSIDNFERNYTGFNEKSRELILLTFNLNTKETYIERQYLKIQELMANMGGFLKVVMFICKVLNHFNSEVTLINEVEQIEYIAAKKYNQIIQNQNYLSQPLEKSSSDSKVTIQSKHKVEAKSIGLCDFIKNMLTCKF